jgi:hypothetical protein
MTTTMTPKRRTQQRNRWLDSRDGCPPSPPQPHLSSTGEGGWSRPSAAACPTPTDAAAPAQPSYADATAPPQDTTDPPNPITQLSPLHGTPSLRPHTTLRPLALAEWNPGWHDDGNADNDSSDKDSDVGGSDEMKHDDPLAVDDTAVTNRDDTATNTAKDATSSGSDSPPLLSSSPYPSIGAHPADDDDPMAALNRAISAHLSELDRQQRAIGDKYDAFRALLVTAQATFNAPAIELRVRSAIGAHTAPFSELISQAESAIDRKYDEINALHVASKSTISSAMMLLDAPALSQRALAAVDDAIRSATAPDGLLDQRIGDSIASAVSSAVTTTLDEIFVSYRDCVLVERQAAEADLAASFHKACTAAVTDFQTAVATTTLDSIGTLNVALRSAAAEFAAKRDSVVRVIEHA